VSAQGARPASALHHRWDDLTCDRPLEQLVRRRVIGERVMLSHVTLEEGCHVESHAHENEQMAVVLSGAVRFAIGAGKDARTLDVRAGEVLHLPSGLPHAATALEESVVLDVFSPPSEATGIDR